MQVQTANRTDAEIVWGSFTNVSGATITLGYAIAFTTTAASLDGNAAVIPATGQLGTFAGCVVIADVPDNEVGTYQAYGYLASTFIFATGTSVTNAIDVTLGPGPSSLGVNSTGLVDILAPVRSMEAIGAAINSPGGYAKCFIRAM